MKILPDTYVWKARTDYILEVTLFLVRNKELFNDSSTLRYKTFFNTLAYISGKTYKIVMKILSRS